MKNGTKRLCRAGVIAALYAALTYAFAPFAYGGFQIRPSEALCVLPLLFPESIFALTVGCVLSNLPSPYFLYDTLFGGAATFLAALCTYLVSKPFKRRGAQLAVGGIFPVLFNALVLPLMMILLFDGGDGYSSFLAAYLTLAGSIAVTESICVYALGAPLFFAVKRLQPRVRFLSE